MKLFNLGNGLYWVQSGVFLTKFGHNITPFLSAQPDSARKSWKKLLGRSALCVKVTSDPVIFLITMLIF